MLMHPDIELQAERLAGRLAQASRASAALVADIFAASPRLMTLHAMGKTERIDRLVSSEAWTEAAIDLIALDAPGWSVKRLYHDDGEWLCTLSRLPEIPDWLDDSAEGRHPVLALAILEALLEARARTVATPPPISLKLAGVATDCTNYR